MLTRFIGRPTSHLRLLTLICSPAHFSTPNPHHPTFTNPNSNFPFSTPRSFSTNRNNNNGNDYPTPKIDLWKLSTENEDESVFEDDGGGTLERISGGDGKPAAEESWLRSPAEADGGDNAGDDIFKGVEKEVEVGNSEEWAAGDGAVAWSWGGEEDKVDDVFGIGDDDVIGVRGDGLGGPVEIGKSEEERKVEEERRLKEEEKVISDVLKGKLQFLMSFLNLRIELGCIYIKT